MIFVWLLSLPFLVLADETDNFRDVQSLMQVLKLVRQNYDGDISTQELVNNAIKGMIEELDPHTAFYTEKEFKSFFEQTSGHFGGLGIVISTMGKYVTVVEPIEDSPALKAGMMSGDKIIAVDGEDVVGLDINELIKKLKGKPGTKVKVTVKRFDQTKDFDLERAVINVSSVPYKFLLGGDIGYVKLRQFNGNTTEDFIGALRELKEKGATKYIIDLRNNPGGLLQEALTILDEFVDKGKLLLTTKGKNSSFTKNYYSNYPASIGDVPLVVLVNSGSASASEIFAGVLQDYDKALIIGSQSYGKGSVQQTYTLPNAEGIKMTIAKYYVPSGRCVHNSFNDSIIKNYSDTISKEFLKEKMKEYKENNKHKVFNTLGGRKVYGGGGILPDVEVEEEEYSQLEKDFILNNSYFDYSVNYFNENADNIDEFFEADSRTIVDFVKYVKNNQKIETKKSSVDSVYNKIKVRLESEILRRKFSPNVAQKKLLNVDPDVKAALEILQGANNTEQVFRNSKKYIKAHKKEK